MLDKAPGASLQLKRVPEIVPLWMRGALVGKVGGVFCSTSSQHGDQETTLISFQAAALAAKQLHP